jgi:polar amino acid transport system substrate-binding protein
MSVRAKGVWIVLGQAILLAAILPHCSEADSLIPALYTEAQAQAGKAVFETNCATCHGEHLEGRAGPALKGEKFASPAANLEVRDIFSFLSTNMPAYAPGSLQPEQYVEAMAFLLRENGYPAGKTALTSDVAGKSTVPLIYRSPRTTLRAKILPGKHIAAD